LNSVKNENSNVKNNIKTGDKILQNKMLRYVLGAVLPLILVLGYFFPLIGFFMLICMFAAIIISFFNGRYWCYWACPRGIFYDEYLNKISLKKKVPSFFKHIAFRILWILILMSMLTYRFIQSNGNLFVMGKTFVMILTVTTIIGVGLGIVYNTRIWCMFCPIGTMSSWFGKGKNSVKIEGNKCVSCNICYRKCPMEINASDYKETGYINNGDCIKCKKCIESCPKKILD